MKRRGFIGLVGTGAAGASLLAVPDVISRPQSQVEKPTQTNELAGRMWWVNQLTQLCKPVWQNLAAGKLRAEMPVEIRPGNTDDRKPATYLEAVARSFVGLAPWLALTLPPPPADGTIDQFAEERALQQEWRKLVQKGLDQLMNPKSRDYQQFEGSPQLLVDAAFLAYGFLQPGAWQVLFDPLNERTKEALVDGWLATRKIKPYESNWLLFSAMVELALEKAGEPIILPTIEYALKRHNEWYKGDGIYGDGPEYHQDYYNSYVIHPFLDVLCKADKGIPEGFEVKQAKRSARYSHIQLRSIMADGSFPVYGRSIVYRCGAFHHLASRPLESSQLPQPELVRRKALELVIRKTLGPENYDSRGWLLLGLKGHQPWVAETYISTGSLYLCSAAFLPLGLSPDQPFWAEATAPVVLPSEIWTGNAGGLLIDGALK